MRQEAVPVAGGKPRSPYGLLLALVLEEHLKVRVVDIAQLHVGHGGECAWTH